MDARRPFLTPRRAFVTTFLAVTAWLLPVGWKVAMTPGSRRFVGFPR